MTQNWDDSLENQLWSPPNNWHQQKVDEMEIFSLTLWGVFVLYVCLCVEQRVEAYSFVSRINCILLRQAQRGRRGSAKVDGKL